MTKHLFILLSYVLLVGCGGTAADTLRGDPWTISKWTYSVESVFDGHANMPPSRETSTASEENCGTLTFTGGETVEIGGGGQLTRSFTKMADRGTSEAKFANASRTDTLGWDPGGFKSEDDKVTIYDGNDPSWNGAWTVEGSGDEVTITRTSGTEFSPTQRQLETHTLVLTR